MSYSPGLRSVDFWFSFCGLLSMSWVSGFQVQFLCPTLLVSGRWILGSVSVSYSPGLRSVDFMLISVSYSPGLRSVALTSLRLCSVLVKG